MLRLESGCSAAGLHLALALRRAWMVIEHEFSRSQARMRLRAICALCPRIVEAKTSLTQSASSRQLVSPIRENGFESPPPQE